VPELSLTPDYIARLIVKMRAVQGRENLTDPMSGSNAPDDNEIDALQDTPGDLSREELREEISGLSPGERAELVALMWTGRGDCEPEEWESTVELASSRAETPTAHYLMSEPLVADFWANGLEKLGVAVPLGGDLSANSASTIE
jgi:hypothetical protein